MEGRAGKSWGKSGLIKEWTLGDLWTFEEDKSWWGMLVVVIFLWRTESQKNQEKQCESVQAASLCLGGAVRECSYWIWHWLWRAQSFSSSPSSPALLVFYIQISNTEEATHRHFEFGSPDNKHLELYPNVICVESIYLSKQSSESMEFIPCENRQCITHRIQKNTISVLFPSLPHLPQEWCVHMVRHKTRAREQLQMKGSGWEKKRNKRLQIWDELN